MDYWEEYALDNKVKDYLKTVKYKKNENHHLGRPYVNGYQIAIGLQQLYPIEEWSELSIGGKGLGVNKSLAQDIARRLSQNIKNNSKYEIEGAFIADNFVENINYKDKNSNTIEPSIFETAIFRIKD